MMGILTFCCHVAYACSNEKGVFTVIVIDQSWKHTLHEAAQRENIGFCSSKVVWIQQHKSCIVTPTSIDFWDTATSRWDLPGEAAKNTQGYMAVRAWMLLAFIWPKNSLLPGIWSRNINHINSSRNSWFAAADNWMKISQLRPVQEYSFNNVLLVFHVMVDHLVPLVAR